MSTASNRTRLVPGISDTNNATMHAVLGAGAVHYHMPGWRGDIRTQSIKTMPESLIELFEWALDSGFSHVWVLPEAGVIADEQWVGVALPAGKLGTEYEDEKHSMLLNFAADSRQLSSASIRRQPSGGQKQIMIMFLGNTRWARVDDEDEDNWCIGIAPRELLGTVFYLQNALDVPMGGSPSTMGWALLRKYHPDWVKDGPIGDLKSKHFGPHAAKPIIWQRPLQADELEDGMYLIKADKGMQFPDAASSSFYGIGSPVYTKHYDAKKVGTWHIRAHYNPAAHPLLPPIYTGGTEGWVAGPLVRLLQSQGYEVEILEGWAFVNNGDKIRPHMLLRQWANKLWDSRAMFRRPLDFKNPRAARAAADCIKQIAVSTIGVTAYGGFEEDEYTDKRRPDIKLETVARAIELMHHNIMKFFALYGQTPVMVYADALYYVCKCSNGRVAFPAIFAREGQLGGYKYEGSIKITPVVRDILTAKMSVNKKLHELNELGWNIEEAIA